MSTQPPSPGSSDETTVTPVTPPTQPTYGTSTPPPGDTEPIRRATQPTYGSEHPSYGTRQPAYGSEHSSYGASPTFGAPSGPSYGEPSPYGQQPTQAQPGWAPAGGTTSEWWGGPVQPPAGPGYGAPAGPGPVPTSATPSRGFLSKLFDLSFTTFVMPSIVKVVYVLAIVAIALGWLLYTGAAFETSAGLGLLVLLVVGPLVSLVSLVAVRILLELHLAVVRLAEDVHELRQDRQERSAG